MQVLDVLRGFALCGVFVSNAYMWFSGRVFVPQAQAQAAALNAPLVDDITRQITSLLVFGKFITIFSFLFGLGFSVQMGRAETRGAPIGPLYARRLWVMLGLGLLHVCLFWYGDILSVYALLGFGLLLFRQRTDRTLLWWAALLILVSPGVGQFLVRLPQFLAGSPEAVDAAMKAAMERSAAVRAETLEVFRHGTWPQVMGATLRFYRDDFFLMVISSHPAIFGRFLLGFLVGRHRAFHDVAAHRTAFRRVLVWGLAVGVLGSGVGLVFQHLAIHKVIDPMTLPKWVPFALGPVRALGEVGMAAFYVSGLTLLFQRATWQRLLGVLAPVGRMALTNYLSQTVISCFIYYGYGLGKITQVGPTACVALCLGIFCVQILWSHLWLSRFRFGPVEWVWRSLTYGKAQPMRRAHAGASTEAVA